MHTKLSVQLRFYYNKSAQCYYFSDIYIALYLMAVQHGGGTNAKLFLKALGKVGGT